jgi:hypothetical protein
MAITLNGTTGITTPAETATTSVTTPLLTSPAATALTIQSAGTTAMTVDTSQRLGIGTTSPAQLLDIEKAATDVQVRVGDASGNYYDIGRNTSTGLLTFYGSQAVAAGYDFYTSASGGNRVRIDSSGNLLVGTTDQLNGSYQSILNLKGGNINGIVIQTTATNWSPLVALSTTGTLVGNISSNNTSLSYNTTSDYRLKENVAAMTTGLATVKALKPVTYNWISDKSAGEGFIAHELQAVIPHAVTGERDAINEDGSIKPQGVDYSKVVVHLVAAIQELEARLAAVEAK